MNSRIYKELTNIMYEFMDFEVQLGVIWTYTQSRATDLFENCGYFVSDWSWYDGHIVSLLSKQYSNIEIDYAACADSYTFSSTEFPGLAICIEEVPKIRTEPSDHIFDRVPIYKVLENKPEEVHITNPTPEFREFVQELYQWVMTFDKSEDLDYTVSIYVQENIEVTEL